MDHPSTKPLFVLIGELAEKDGVMPLHEHRQHTCWERKVGNEWWIAVNPHEGTKRCSRGANVDFGHCYVEFMGFPAGLFTPWGGTIAAGTVANEESFAAALEAELAK